MEYISGFSLKYMLEKNGILPEATVLKYVRQIGEALQFVHDKSILHLDIKPSNILIDKNGNVPLDRFRSQQTLRYRAGRDQHYDVNPF